MLSAIYRFFQETQPIHITGALRHAGLWLTASFSDVVYLNPKHEPSKHQVENIAVYCVHGTADRSNSFSLIAGRMLKEREGLSGKISTIHLSAFNGRYQGNDIEFFAKQLLEKIKKNEHKNVILMGHSRGGLVIAYLTEYLAKIADVNVLCVIPICSPFMGSGLAMSPLSSLSGSVKEMEHFSDFLKDLEAKILKTTTPYFYFAAENDDIVSPKSCCIPQHSQRMRELSRHGHLSIMSSWRLTYLLQNCIADVLNVKAELADEKEPAQSDNRYMPTK